MGISSDPGSVTITLSSTHWTSSCLLNSRGGSTQLVQLFCLEPWSSGCSQRKCTCSTWSREPSSMMDCCQKAGDSRAVLVTPEKREPFVAGSLTQVASLEFASLPSLDLIHQIVRNSNTIFIRITQTRKNSLSWHLYTAVSSNSLVLLHSKALPAQASAVSYSAKVSAGLDRLPGKATIPEFILIVPLLPILALEMRAKDTADPTQTGYFWLTSLKLAWNKSGSIL